MNKVLASAARPVLGLAAAAAMLAACSQGSGGGRSTLPNNTTQSSVLQSATITFAINIHSEAPGDRSITMTMNDANGHVLISATCVRLEGNAVGGPITLDVLAHRLCTAGVGGLYTSGTLQANEDVTATSTACPPVSVSGKGVIIGKSGQLTNLQGQFSVTGSYNAFCIPFPWTSTETWRGQYNNFPPA